ncbi:hypothetical protein, partial [Acinetobacter baumannii]|uniref:hypothetical protein n=1 Tax=Acinetobacter baumannii TaxID=470 RepID=UPI00332AD664
MQRWKRMSPEERQAARAAFERARALRAGIGGQCDHGLAAHRGQADFLGLHVSVGQRHAPLAP